MAEFTLTPKEALARLKAGNRQYIERGTNGGDVSPMRRAECLTDGQRPYATIITCSDSRVIPETIFSAGIGDLFVIRIAGNVIDSHQLGSIEYAAGHLGCNLVVVLGHDHCGAVDAAMNHNPDGYIKFITDEILRAIGEETDPDRACRLNVLRSRDIIARSLKIPADIPERGAAVIGAIYHLEDGSVEFFEE